jgi:signal transduction histidine kinase
MSQSQAEVRQSVWDLRRLVQEQFDLPVAMLETARDMASGLELKIELETAGSVRSLPEIIEENFLRISREGVVNAIKYSQASALMLRLEFEPARVVLEVRDNGRGFDPHQAAGPEHGHFGLLGVSERVKRLGGRFTLQTAVGQGTTLRVEIPLAPPAETFLADGLNGAGASADFLSAAPTVPPADAAHP